MRARWCAENLNEVESGWVSPPGTTTSVDVTSGEISVTFNDCKVTMPAITIPANTEVDAWLDVSLPVMLTGTWTVNLTAIVDGVERDGISVEHTQ